MLSHSARGAQAERGGLRCAEVTGVRRTPKRKPRV